MNTSIRFAARLSLAAGLSLAALGAAHAADYTMRLSHHWLPSLVTATNIDQFAADVKEATKGRIEVQIFPSAQLFKPNQEHVAVATGKVEAAVVLDFTMSGSIPEMNLMLIPYLTTTMAKVNRFPKSEAAKMLDAKLQEKGLTNIAWINEAVGGMFSSEKKPLVKPEDFQGVKIRGLSKIYDLGLSAMGAAPSSMPASELYQALQTGVLDASVTVPSNGLERKLYEVQKFGVVSHIASARAMLVVNPTWLKSLPDDLRQALLAAGKKVEQRSAAKSDELYPEAVKALRERGMTMIVLTPAQEKAIADVMQPPVLKAYKALGPDAVKLVEIVNKL